MSHVPEGHFFLGEGSRRLGIYAVDWKVGGVPVRARLFDSAQSMNQPPVPLILARVQVMTGLTYA